jgi:hypothetical protein
MIATEQHDLWSAAMALGDWRHPGIYAIVHIPTGLQYIGASQCVKHRLNAHFQGAYSPIWSIRLKQELDRRGADVSTVRDRRHYFPVWLETCSPKAEELKDRERHHIQLLCPVLNAQRPAPYTCGKSRNTSKWLDTPPPRNGYRIAELTKIRHQLRELQIADGLQARDIQRTRDALISVICESAFRQAEAEYADRVRERVGDQFAGNNGWSLTEYLNRKTFSYWSTRPSPA